MQTFPNDQDPDLYVAVLTAGAAIGLVRQRGGRMVQDAEDVIETTRNDPSSLHAERRDSLLEILDQIERVTPGSSVDSLRHLLTDVSGVPVSSADAPSIGVMDGLRVTGDWINSDAFSCLIVDGDLVVDGTLTLNCLDDSIGVIVLGSLRTGNLICGGWVVVRDDVECRHVHACSLNDGALLVGGNMAASTLVEAGHYIQIGGKLDIRYIGIMHTPVEVQGHPGIPSDGLTTGRENLNQWVDGALLEQVEYEGEDGEVLLGWYPSEAYAARIASGGSPLRCDA